MKNEERLQPSGEAIGVHANSAVGSIGGETSSWCEPFENFSPASYSSAPTQSSPPRLWIRYARRADVPSLLDLYAAARRYMATTGNANQWYEHKPTLRSVAADLDSRSLYVVVDDAGTVHAAFALVPGTEPTYEKIRGAWLNDNPYWTVHRIASDGTVRGVLAACVSLARRALVDLRIDTHRKNASMRAAIERAGFSQCGIIWLADGDERLAYQLPLVSEPDGLTIDVVLPDELDVSLVEQLHRIYAHYVENTAITFEYAVPSLGEFTSRLESVAAMYPLLVAREGAVVLGYSYASQFKARPAYNWAVETTIYVNPNHRKGGVGRALYTALEHACAAQGVLNLNACIGVPATSQTDEYLNFDSQRFHERMGYRFVGEFRACGFKYGRWYNMIWMEKHVGEHRVEPREVVPFPSIAPDFRTVTLLKITTNKIS